MKINLYFIKWNIKQQLKLKKSDWTFARNFCANKQRLRLIVFTASWAKNFWNCSRVANHNAQNYRTGRKLLRGHTEGPFLPFPSQYFIWKWQNSEAAARKMRCLQGDINLAANPVCPLLSLLPSLQPPPILLRRLCIIQTSESHTVLRLMLFFHYQISPSSVWIKIAAPYIGKPAFIPAAKPGRDKLEVQKVNQFLRCLARLTSASPLNV